MSGSELRRIRSRAQKFRMRYLSADVAASDLPLCRIAVVVGKHGHKIVDRNRLRRRLRELVRLHLLPACSGIDVVLRASGDAYDADFKILAIEIETLAVKLASFARD